MRASPGSRALLALTLSGLAFGGAPRTAFALAPLSTFVEAAGHVNLDNREAAHRAEEADAQAAVATGTLLPSLNLQGKYTRNQYNVAFALEAGQPPLAVVPTDQWDFSASLNVPLIDLRAFARSRAARLDAGAAREDVRRAALDVERQVVVAYYQFGASLALVASTRSALAAAEENLRVVQAQRAAGAVAEVDVQQALGERATDEQNVAEAELQRELSRRQLGTLTGLVASDDTLPGAIPDFGDLHEERPLAEWVSHESERPSVVVATLSSRAADASRDAAKLALVPTLSGTASEHVTNANAFALGHIAVYAAGAALTWNLDFAAEPSIRARSEAAEVARVQSERSRITAGDEIYQAWWTVHTDIVSSRAASVRSKAAHLAADLARDRYQKGVGTQLEVIQSLRDATAADVGRIRAEGSLAASRAALRIAAGISLTSGTDAARNEPH